MSDEYDFVAKGKLKLKNDSEFKKKKKSKKKSKDKEKQKIKKLIEDEEEKSTGDTTKSQNSSRYLTKAELSFKKMQEKMQTKRILEKASTTHKQRVEKFNEHLDTLTEHFDIPKVSWTK